jgi:hypothetical protein
MGKFFPVYIERLLCGTVVLCVVTACQAQKPVLLKFSERQLTHKAKGHTLHNTQVFSKDGRWIVYDTRNDDTQIASTGSIEMVNTATGETKVLYQTSGQTIYGPGVGAATFSPARDRVLFIHGIRNADQTRPYGMTRRTGVAIDVARPQQPIWMDARDITPPFTPGALRGGTHAHTWSGDGQWISFTYNDYVTEQQAKTDTSVMDMRRVGVMVPGRVVVNEDNNLENNSGDMFSVVVTEVKKNPKPGSDEINKAFDESWIGTNGYLRSDGNRQRRAIAFQGNVINEAGKTITEVFVADLPADLKTVDSPLELPKGIVQRRITHTKNGIEGPRHWLRTTPDGSLIFFLAKDEGGIVQIFSVSPNGVGVRQVTHNGFSVQGTPNTHPKGDLLVYPANNRIYITHILSGKTYPVTSESGEEGKPIGAASWSPDGNSITYNKYVKEANSAFLQIFLLKKAD